MLRNINKKAAATVGALVTLFVLAVTLVATAAPGDVAVTLTTRANSGISGSATYGTYITGKATGMDPSQRYYSFIYGKGSSASGKNPCILTGEAVLPSQVNVGEWDVDSDGNGTLRTKAPVDADDAGALSIRRVGYDAPDKTDGSTTAGVLGSGGATIPLNPATYPLVACGQVGARQSTTLGGVQDQAPALPRVPAPDTLTKSPGAAVPTTVTTPNVPALQSAGVQDPDSTTTTTKKPTTTTSSTG